MATPSKSETPPQAPARRSPFRLFLDAFAGRAWVALTAAASIILIARSAGVETYGAYATATGFSQLLAVWTDLGSGQVVVREHAKVERKNAVQAYLWVRVFLTLATIIVGAAIVPIAFAPEYRLAAWVSLGSVLFCGPSVGYPLGQILGDMRMLRNSFSAQGAITFISTAGIVAFIDDPSAATLALGPVAGAFAATVVALVWVARSDFSVRGRVPLREVLTMSRSVGVVGFGTVLSSLYGRIDSILLLRIAGPAEAGLYAAAYKVLDQTRLLPIGLTVPLSAPLAKELNSGEPGRATVVSAGMDERIRRLAGSTGLGMTAAVAGFAPLAILVLAGPDFDESSRLLAVLAASSAWLFASQMLMLHLVHAGREKVWAMAAAASVVINVVGNLIAIPKWGAMGAAGATLITEGLFLLMVAALTERHSRLPRVRLAGALIAAALAISLVALSLEDLNETWADGAGMVVGVIGLGAIAYGVNGLRKPTRPEPPGGPEPVSKAVVPPPLKPEYAKDQH